MYRIKEPELIDLSKPSGCKNNFKKDDYFEDIEQKVEYFMDNIILDRTNNLKIHSGSIGLVSKFGSGKTFFMQYLFCRLFQLKKKTNNKYRIYPVYIDIAKYESSQDKLLMLLFSEITRIVKKVGGKSKDSPFSIIKKLLPLATKVATKMWMNKVTNIEELVSGAGEASETLAQYMVDILDEDEEYKKRLEQLSEKAPLVIMIDNLDRCRPEFVLDFFVLTKRMFDVNNILFLISYDKQQIINLLKSLYSDNIDISSYMRKYISSEFYLPQIHNVEKFTRKYCTHFFKHSIPNNIDFSKGVSERNLSLLLWEELYTGTRISLRQYQHGINLIITLYNENDYMIKNNDASHPRTFYTSLMIYMKIMHPYEYQNLYYFILWQKDSIEHDDILNVLESFNSKLFELDVKNAIKVLNNFSRLKAFSNNFERIRSEENFNDRTTRYKSLAELIVSHSLEKMQILFENIEFQVKSLNPTYTEYYKEKEEYQNERSKG